VKQFIFLVSLLIGLVSAKGQGAVIMQDKAFVYQHKKDSGILATISREAAYSNMLAFEQDAVYWINFMRRNPGQFRVDFLKPFLAQFPEMQSAAARSLDKELTEATAMSVLLPSINLDKAASLQAGYLVESHQFTHTGPRGKSFKQRMEDVGIKGCAGENLFEGKADPLVSLILLLIDQGVSGYGHRKALLNTAFGRIGVSAMVDGAGSMMMVQVFSCQ
jgi:hypothetical protein